MLTPVSVTSVRQVPCRWANRCTWRAWNQGMAATITAATSNQRMTTGDPLPVAIASASINRARTAMAPGSHRCMRPDRLARSRARSA
jgi:hypothetical protein